MASATSCCSIRPRLILHFDINKTIVMSDKVKGFTGPMMANSILSEACWGSPDASADTASPAHKWRPRLETPQTDPVAGLVTYGDYLERVLKLPKKERDFLKSHFTETGHPGERYRTHYQQLHQKLCQGASEAGVDDSGGSIVPSFFRLLMWLEAAKRDFALIFRTFGIDIAGPHGIATEFNAFCNGHHPRFPGVMMNGSHSDSLDRRLHFPSGTGEFCRDALGAHLALVTSNNVVSMAHGFGEIDQMISQKLFGDGGVATLGLRDFYPFWASRGESSDSGKLLLVDRYPKNDSPNTLQIFFDDNIERDYAHIIDVRDRLTGEPIPFEEARGRFLVRSEPLCAVSDESYFIQQVEKCEQNWLDTVGGPQN